MRIETLGPTLIALAFGVVALSFGVVEFVRAGNAQEALEAKLSSIDAGTVAPETLVVARKYVNPGKHGLPHVVFRSGRNPQVDVAATVDFFNSVQPGDAVKGYDFADGYFFPENRRNPPGAGRWFVLGVGSALAGLAGFIVFRLQSVGRAPRT